MSAVRREPGQSLLPQEMELESSCRPASETAPRPQSLPRLSTPLPDILAVLCGQEAQEIGTLVIDLSYKELFLVLWTLERPEVSWISYFLSCG